MKKTKGLLISSLFLAVIVLVGAGAVGYAKLAPFFVSETTTVSKPSGETTVKDESAVKVDTGECVFPNFDPNAVPEAGFVTDWKPWGERIKVPVSAHGALVIDPVPHCFAPTVEGAILAAGTWVLTGMSGENTAEVYEQMVYRDTLGLEAIRLIKSKPNEMRPPFELKGWNFQRLAPDHMVVYVAASRIDAPKRLLQIGVELKYQDGGWKYVFSKQTDALVSELFSLEAGGFKRW